VDIDQALTTMLMSILNALVTLYLTIARLHKRCRDRFNTAYYAFAASSQLHATWHFRMGLPEASCRSDCSYMLATCVGAVRAYFVQEVRRLQEQGRDIWPRPAELGSESKRPGPRDPDEPIGYGPHRSWDYRPEGQFDRMVCKETSLGVVYSLDARDFRKPRVGPGYTPHGKTADEFLCLAMRVIGSKLSIYRSSSHYWTTLEFKSFLSELIYHRDAEKQDEQRPIVSAYYQFLDQGGLTIPVKALVEYGAHVLEIAHDLLTMDTAKRHGAQTFVHIRREVDSDVVAGLLWQQVVILTEKSRGCVPQRVSSFRATITQALCNTLFKEFLKSWPSQRTDAPGLSLRGRLKAGGTPKTSTSKKNEKGDDQAAPDLQGRLVERGFWSEAWCKCNNLTAWGEYVCNSDCWEQFKISKGRYYRPRWCTCTESKQKKLSSPWSPLGCYASCWDDYDGEILENKNTLKSKRTVVSRVAVSFDVPPELTHDEDDTTDAVHPAVELDHAASGIALRHLYAERMAIDRSDSLSDPDDEHEHSGDSIAADDEYDHGGEQGGVKRTRMSRHRPIPSQADDDDDDAHDADETEHFVNRRQITPRTRPSRAAVSHARSAGTMDTV
jgi:hypothetical protein